MSHQPNSTLPQCCGDAAQAKAAYRFFDHKELHFEGLLTGHLHATWERIGHTPSDAPVLLLEDSSALNFQRHSPIEGLGPIGGEGAKAQGLWLHSTLAFNSTGCCLGFVHAQCWARDPAKAGLRHQCHDRLAQDKESYRWVSSLQKIALGGDQQAPDQKLIRIADREADLWEVLAETQRHLEKGGSLHVLTRSRYDRKVEAPTATISKGAKVSKQTESLWEKLSQSDLAVRQKFMLPARSARPGKQACAAREAGLEVRYCAVKVQPSCRSEKTSQKAVECWAVEALETEPPKGCEPLHWRLLTTWPVKEAQTAIKVLQGYRQRWQIEVMHKVLKSGLGIEQRGLRTGQRLEAVLALSMIVAWRIMSLMHLSRHEEYQQHPAEEILEEEECAMLQMVREAKNRKQESKQGLNVKEATEEIARLGGWLGRRRDPPPGIVVLWRGLQRLEAQLEGYRLARKLMGNR